MLLLLVTVAVAVAVACNSCLLLLLVSVAVAVVATVTVAIELWLVHFPDVSVVYEAVLCVLVGLCPTCGVPPCGGQGSMHAV